jgi:hypothetical protein
MLEKFVTEDEVKTENPQNIFYVEIKKEVNEQIIDRPEEEETDDLDEDTLNFFLDFIKNNKNHSSREKVEKIINMINSTAAGNPNKSILTNKMKNEFLRNLKSEYLRELDELNSKFIYLTFRN